MEKYTLDQKGGISKLFRKKPSKILLKDDTIEVVHFSSFNSVRMLITDLSDTTIKLRVAEENPDLQVSSEDAIVLTYFSDKGYYTISGNISSIEEQDPLEITVNVAGYGRSKDLVKENIRYVSYLGTMSSSKAADPKPTAVIKVIGLRAIKVDCKEEFQVGNKVDVTANLDKRSKLFFTGEIVKKQKLGNYIEYGIVVKEITESNSRLMHSCVGGVLE